MEDFNSEEFSDKNDNELFAQYRRLFLFQLKSHAGGIEKLEKKINDLEKEQLVLKTKAAMVATIGGTLVSIAVNVLLKFL